ncbi:hypothetical protein GCM10023238_14390 [Streptomyces heliomycini]
MPYILCAYHAAHAECHEKPECGVACWRSPWSCRPPAGRPSPSPPPGRAVGEARRRRSGGHAAAPAARPARRGQTRAPGASGQTATGAAWSQTALGLSRAQRISRGGGVTVAVVDTGVSTGVPSLSGRVEAVDAAADDCVGHGTFAAA